MGSGKCLVSGGGGISQRTVTGVRLIPFSLGRAAVDGITYFKKNELLVENANSETGAFALLFEFDGDLRAFLLMLRESFDREKLKSPFAILSLTVYKFNPINRHW